MSKASNGDGSVYQRKDGRWVAAVVDRSTGRKRSAYFATEAKANRALRGMSTRADEGGVVLDAGTTLRVYGDAWLTERGPRRRRESTVREYRRRLESYVFPAIGGLRLRELTPLVIEDLYDDLGSKSGLARSSVQGVRNALAAVLSDAVRGRLLTSNVARQAQLPERLAPATGVVPPTVENVGALLDAAQDTTIGNLLLILAATGARVGEALGATWADVDLENGVWHVCRTTTLALDGSVKLGTTTKTGQSRRVALVPEAVAALRAQRVDNAALRLACPIWQDFDLVFPSSVGTPQDARNVRKILRPLTDAVGFPGSFHALRHFVASVALSSVPLPVVSKVLGHKRAATTTDLYAHLLESDAGSVAVAVNVAVKAARRRSS
jgi:integrase